MKPEDIHIIDWQRILIGEVPGGFYLEVVFRTVVIYLILMVSMRLMGRKMASQLSTNEMIAMVSLAAAIGVPLQSPDRGILAAVVIAAIVVAVQRILAKKVVNNEKFEELTQGDISMLIEDGYMNLDKMKNAGITRERIFSQLRNNNVKQLGEVKRLYFEAGGSFSLIKNSEAVPGLGVLPIYDQQFLKEEYKYSEESVCENCGYRSQAGTLSQKTACPNCTGQKWSRAVL